MPALFQFYILYLFYSLSTLLNLTIQCGQMNKRDLSGMPILTYYFKRIALSI